VKMLVCMLMTMFLLISSACAASPAEFVQLDFEDGFSLSLPSDWVIFDVSPDLSEAGFRYCLGSADASRLMYIQRWPTDCATLDALRNTLAGRAEIILRPSSGEFITYQYAEGDCTGCMTLFDGDILNLLFLPQSDPQTMLLAASIIGKLSFHSIPSAPF